MSSNNSILELETLNKEYNLTLKQYNKAMNDYLELTKQTINTQQPQPTTEQQCYAMGGSSFASCSTSGLNYCCGVCNGTGNCESNSGLLNCACTNIYEKQEQELLKHIEKLNDKLSQLSNNIIHIDEKIDPEYKKTIIEEHIGGDILQINLEELTIEKEKIKQLLRSMNDLNEEQNQGELIVTSNYYSYILFLLITLLCVVGVVVVGSYITNNNTQVGGYGLTFKKR